jgi:hypothetical protein
MSHEEDDATSASSFSKEDTTTFYESLATRTAATLEDTTANEDIATSDSKTSSSTRMAAAKLSFMFDQDRQLARLGHNATLRSKCRLPGNVLKSDIHVHVDIDERARNPGQRRLEENILEEIQDDLATVYSASKDSAKFVLCIVIVVLTDGSLSRLLWDSYGVAGLAEIGLVWRLFEADNLKVYEGGLVVQRQDFGYSVLDFFRFQGRACLLDKLVPRVANDVMSRIGGANEALLVEI